jgi:hypothetical protein
MGVCDVCGNEYAHAFEVTLDGATHTFDSFECAIHHLAPTCGNCGCRVLGHGTEHNVRIFCGAHCALEAGVVGARDHI